MPAVASSPTPSPALRSRLRLGLAIFFIVAGLAHFVAPSIYATMMPPWLPAPRLMIYLSGLAEIFFGIGILITRTRRLAAWGLIALLIAIFPANLHVAFHPEAAAALSLSQLALFIRLPFQLLFIAWVWWTCLARTPTAKT
jgi:uncharacterized membrane protein